MLALCLACTVEDGERASTGECPAGEVCSESVSGLTFFGPPPTDEVTDLLPYLAEEGTFHLAFAPADETEVLPDVRVESSSPWHLTARGADDTRQRFVTRAENDVRLEGVSSGSARVQVRDADTGDLIDQVEIRVARVERVDAVDATPVGAERRSVVFQLHGAQARLIDESLEATSEDVVLEQVSWDCFDFDVPADFEGDSISFTVSAGHRRWAVTLPR